MPNLTRRTLLPLLAAPVWAAPIWAAAAPVQAATATAQATAAQTAAWETPRTLGKADAKIVVEEWFSLTCTHCAHFAATTFPQVRTKLIDTGKVRWVFRDFPLDRVALAAAQVARALPPDRYTAFVLTLFSTQDRWAFGAGKKYPQKLWEVAALAGMDRATFDAAFHDKALQDWILAQQKHAETKWKIDATPSFVINGQMIAGEMPYDSFVKQLPGLG